MSTSVESLFTNKVRQLTDALSRKPNFIQIGCKDGVDHFTNLLKTNEYKAMMFEPTPYWHSKLVKTYEGCDKIKIYNQALCDTVGKIQMYWVDPNKHGDNVPEWYYGHSSIHYKHSPGHEWGLANTSELITVSATRLDEVLKENPTFDIDVYISDTEGNDISILRQLDLNKYKPYIFHIESNKIDDNDVQFLKNLFEDNNYKFVNNYQDLRLESTALEYSGNITPGVDLLAWRDF